MATTTVTCDQCKTSFEKENGALNRIRKIGSPIYCCRKCAGLARRVSKSADQKKAEKREYDKQYRAKNKDLLKAKKADYFQKTYDPEKARIERKKRAPIHAEYCRRTEYKKWKRSYDREYRAKKFYGEFWESFLLTLDIRDECLSRQSAYQIRLDNETLNKTQRRKRDVRQTINSN